MKKTVIFLGAGASKADGAPLQAELFKSYIMSSLTPPNAYDQNSYDKMKCSIYHFFSSFFGLDLKDVENNDTVLAKMQFPTFEEALGILDLAISKNEEYKYVGKSMQFMRESLIFSMAAAIQYQLNNCEEHHRKNHDMLIKNLKEQLLDHTISLISTNYDLLVDNAILNQMAICDYGFSYPNRGNCSDIHLLKIHGSLNWLYCPTCKNIDVKNGQKSMIDATLDPLKSRCPRCESIQASIIVPPTYFKDMSNPFLLKIYETAENELLAAQQIIFCGYSFPDADMHIKYLLKRAELNSNREDPLIIKIINGYNGKRAEISQDESHRYKRFFSNKTIVQYYDDVSFENFATNPSDYL